MRQGINDTDPKAEAVQMEILRRMSPARKLRLVMSLNDTCRQMALAGLRMRNPEAHEEELAQKLSEQILGKELAEKVNRRRRRMMKGSVLDLLEIALKVTRALEELDVPYYICGSLASSFYGEMRSTNDADLVADLKREHVEGLISALAEEFYIDETMIRRAIARQSSFNVIHFQTSYKVDVFVGKSNPYSQIALARRGSVELSTDSSQTVWLSSAEDTVLAKLDWYRLGRCVSDKQWRDILGVIKLQGEALDLAYMRKWAQHLEISDLLEEALTEAELF